VQTRAFICTALAALALPALATAKPQRKPGAYAVGVGVRSINPDPDGRFAGQPVYLGGYGIGGGSPVLAGRPATGILGEGVSVRAIAFSAQGEGFAVADIEAQGAFVALREGPGGLLDIRRDVERRTGGELRASQVIVQSDHSHSGADLMGVWGGAPPQYRALVAERTAEAIVEAWRTRRQGTLWYGTAPGRDLLSNQFDYDAANHAVDSDIRVLQARDRRDRPFATLLNFSAHATVLGSGNTKISGDWVQAANPLLERRLGGRAVTVVATLGRTQPADRGCPDPSAQGDARSLCQIEEYASRVVQRAAQAAASARPLTGPAVASAQTYLIEDVATNPVLLGLQVVGGAAGVPIDRAITPPWLTGAVLGTVTGSARIGDLLLSAFPGEAYPQIAAKVAELATDARGFMTAGLANDQLGYLIAPYEAYPEPVRRTFFNQRGDEVSPVDNDNYAFNVSHTMGERVTCSALRGAGELFGRGSAYRDAYDRCAPFVNDALLAPGADTAER
jgi:hypothetical protein